MPSGGFIAAIGRKALAESFFFRSRLRAMAWLVLPRTLHDLIHREANLRITCRVQGCGHHADFEARAIIEWFRVKRWNPAWELVASHFRCSHCGARHCRADMVGVPNPPPTPIAPIRARPRPIAAQDPPPQLKRVA